MYFCQNIFNKISTPEHVYAYFDQAMLAITTKFHSSLKEIKT